MGPKVIVIVPAFNEGHRILAVVSSLIKYGYDYIVINDGSTDETAVILKKHNLHHIELETNKGQGAALRSGFTFAKDKGYDICIHFDGDGQHQAQDIEKLIQPIISSNVDIVYGSRFLDKKYLKNMPFPRRVILQLARLFEALRTGIWLSDAHCGLGALKIDSCQNMHLITNGMAHASEILSETKRLNLKYEEVSVNIIYPEHAKHVNITRRIFSILKELYFKKK